MAKSKKVEPKILEPIHVLSDLRQRYRAGMERYKNLAIIAAENLGGPADDFEEAMQTLINNANECMSAVDDIGEMEQVDGEFLTVDEVNEVRDIELDEFKKGIVR